ncbi:MAG: helix-turn-helix transcriptional regulator, partial [Oscillospiraceae bacterium]
MSLGDHIRSLRGEKNLSQNDLAELLSVSRQSISKWETDGATPDLDKLVSLSEIFGVSLDTLIKGTPPDGGVPDSETLSPTPAAEKASGRAPHYLIGIILLCFAALITLLFFFMGGGLWSLLFASPVLLCGLLCLYTRRRTGLWCGWALYLSVDLYLRYASGITWRIIQLTPQFEPSM